MIHKGERCPQDAVCIRMLRSAGAIPLCVTNVPEMTYWLETSNLVHGRTNNPYDVNRTAGGSSGESPEELLPRGIKNENISAGYHVKKELIDKL